AVLALVAGAGADHRPAAVAADRAVLLHAERVHAALAGRERKRRLALRACLSGRQLDDRRPGGLVAAEGVGLELGPRLGPQALGDDADLALLGLREELAREIAHDVVDDRLRHRDLRVAGEAGRLEAHVAE